MKKLFFFATVFTLMAPAITHAAERVSCADDDHRYTVTFVLTDETPEISRVSQKRVVATELMFKDRDREIAVYDREQADASRFLRVSTYEFALGGFQYFEISRKRNSNELYGSFLFGINPLRADVQVSCLATTI
jgi:hypothetical protein